MCALPNVDDVQKVSEVILPFIHSFSKMWHFTNHGFQYSEAVKGYIMTIIKICEECEINLNEAEENILMCACWLHDLGRILENNDDKDSEDHAMNSVKIIKKLSEKGHLNLGSIKEEVIWVVATHNSKGTIRLEDVEDIRPITGFDGKVRLRFLCCLFKIADECDLDQRRAPKSVYDILEDQLPQESKDFWLRHRNVITVEPSLCEKKIIIHMNDPKEEKIAESLKSTLIEPRIQTTLQEYGFPLIDCDIYYHQNVDIKYD